MKYLVSLPSALAFLLLLGCPQEKPDQVAYVDPAAPAAPAAPAKPTVSPPAEAPAAASLPLVRYYALGG